MNHLKTDASRRVCKAILVDMLNCAMQSNLDAKNVALSANARIDEQEREEKRILSSLEVELLFKTSRGGRRYPFFVVAFNTGMRIGEIIGLTWDCIDFDNRLIFIIKTLFYLPNNGDAIYEFHLPKSKAGIGSFLDNYLKFDFFREWRRGKNGKSAWYLQELS